MKCDKCDRETDTYLVHDQYNDDIVRDLCNYCLGYPEYLADCPHCDARIAVN